jgi:hypothetical protein
VNADFMEGVIKVFFCSVVYGILGYFDLPFFFTAELNLLPSPKRITAQ